jgi:putative oxidoreductase
MNLAYSSPYLLAAGLATAAGALVHLLIPLGGPTWYAFFGAPRHLVRMAEAHSLYPTLSCLVIAALLFICSAYAFSGAGLLPRLPLLRTGLAGIAAVLLLRGVGFVLLEWFRPGSLIRVSGSQGIDTFLVVSSLICLLIGAAYGWGLVLAWSRLGPEAG